MAEPTTYVILASDGREWRAGWEPVRAPSPETALDKWWKTGLTAEGRKQYKAGNFVAIPERFFTIRTRKVELVEKVSFAPASTKAQPELGAKP